MEDLQIFDSFELEWLDKEWVDAIWDSDFILYSEPSDKYEIAVRKENIDLLLKKCCKVVKAWLAGDDCADVESTSTKKSWETLISKKINVRGLLAMLGYMMKDGQTDDVDINSKLLCLRAADLYLTFLAVPGSDAFNIFSTNLYQRTLESFKLVDCLLPSIKNGKPTSLESFFENDQHRLYFQTCSKFSKKSSLLEGLCDTMSSLCQMTQSFRFKEYLQCLDCTIKTLLEVSRLKNDISLVCSENRPNGASIAALCYDSYLALENLCDYRHGLTDVTIMLTAKHSLPGLMFTPNNSQSTANSHDALIYFLRKLSTSYETETNFAVLTLFQNLMVHCPERTEMRQKQAIVIIKLMSICNESTFVKAMENLILFSHNSKVGCRIFAQEIIGKLLTEVLSSTGGYFAEELASKVRRILVATVLSRCNDRSSLVRSKAMALIADQTEATGKANGILDVSESSCPNRELPSVDRLIEALKSDEPNWLPGAFTVVKMLTDRMEDERAFVRRSALQILKNLAFEYPRLLPEMIPKIGERCRDPSLIVRRFAIQILTCLLEHYPDNERLLDEWIRSVTPQVFDVEVKVQEKTLESFRDLLLARITQATSDEEPNDDLPWRMLKSLTSMKMRKHLSKACHLCAKNGMITSSVVSNVQSHLGTRNDSAAWVLLAAIAESKALPGMHKYVKDYKRLIKNNDFHASLVLEVLRSSWSSLDKPTLEDLCLYLYNSICLFDIDFGLISICVDILDRVTRHLDPSNGEETTKKNASRFMELAEEKIQSFLKGDKEVSATAPFFLKAMSTLGHAALLCPFKVIHSSTLRILEGLILEHDSLPASLMKIKELRASTVVLLAQLAMRDREIAQEVIPIFGRLVRQSCSLDAREEVVLKVNAAKALADLCVRHTALVEPYLSDLCVSMRDPNPTLRQVILVIFIQLLLEDFIKPNGPFFFHVLTMLSDEDRTIRELTIFFIEERLLAKNKGLISQRFLESLYHYNDYHLRQEYGCRKMRDKERKALTLPGRANEGKRRLIYDFMLEHLDLPGKLRLIVKAAAQILGGVCSDAINVSTDEGGCVLRDALYVLGNGRLKPSVACDKSGEDLAEEEPAEARVNSAVNVIVESAKRHGLDVLLPLLAKLWKKLAASGSPLRKDVKSLLLKTMAEYDKSLLSALFNEYPELEKEADGSRSTEGEDDEITDSECSPTLESETAMRLACLQSTPRVVLRRLSSLVNPPDSPSPSPLKTSVEDDAESRLTPSERSFTPSGVFYDEALIVSSTPKQAKIPRQESSHRFKRNLCEEDED